MVQRKAVLLLSIFLLPLLSGAFAPRLATSLQLLMIAKETCRHRCRMYHLSADVKFHTTTCGGTRFSLEDDWDDDGRRW